MKITRKGTPGGDRLWIGNCRSCDSVAEAKQSELTRIIYNKRDGPFCWEQCPVCGASGIGEYGGMLFYPKGGPQYH